MAFPKSKSGDYKGYKIKIRNVKFHYKTLMNVASDNCYFRNIRVKIIYIVINYLWIEYLEYTNTYPIYIPTWHEKWCMALVIIS